MTDNQHNKEPNDFSKSQRLGPEDARSEGPFTERSSADSQEDDNGRIDPAKARAAASKAFIGEPLKENDFVHRPSEGEGDGSTASFQAQGCDDLPMVVWMRGDEDICSEFTMDADAAMAVLGIKRTRLTQISGRELRVGRRRLGRYIKPFYRSIDIDNYLQWTRRSATSQNATAALAKASEELESRTVSLSEDLQGLVGQLPILLRRAVRERLKQWESVFLRQFDRAHRENRDWVLNIRRWVSDADRRQTKLQELSQRLVEKQFDRSSTERLHLAEQSRLQAIRIEGTLQNMQSETRKAREHLSASIEALKNSGDEQYRFLEAELDKVNAILAHLRRSKLNQTGQIQRCLTKIRCQRRRFNADRFNLNQWRERKPSQEDFRAMLPKPTTESFFKPTTSSFET